MGKCCSQGIVTNSTLRVEGKNPAQQEMEGWWFLFLKKKIVAQEYPEAIPFMILNIQNFVLKKYHEVIYFNIYFYGSSYWSTPLF